MTGTGIPNDTGSALTKREQDAALLVAEDELTDEQIAAKVGVAKITIERWKRRADFTAAVEAHREAFKDAALTNGFADKRRRLEVLNLLGEALFVQLTLSEFQAVLRMTDDGEAVHGFDVVRVREFRGTLDDIAKEMGERATKQEISGPNGDPLILTIQGVDTERV